MDDIHLFDAMYSARSIRKLSADPVPEALITRVLESATQASSAGNSQNWFFLVVRDPEQKAKIGAVYRKGSEIASKVYAARGKPEHLTEAQYQRFLRSSGWLWDHLAEAPVILIVCLKRRAMPARQALPPEVSYESEVAYLDRIQGASIYPAIQNIMKEALDIPDDVTTYALMPIGWPLQNFGPLTRKPVREVAFADKWGEAWRE